MSIVNFNSSRRAHTGVRPYKLTPRSTRNGYFAAKNSSLDPERGAFIAKRRKNS